LFLWKKGFLASLRLGARIIGEDFMNKEIGIAVIGSGYWGKNLVRNYYEMGNLRLICDKNETVLAAFKEQYPGVFGFGTDHRWQIFVCPFYLQINKRSSDIKCKRYG